MITIHLELQGVNFDLSVDEIRDLYFDLKELMEPEDMGDDDCQCDECQARRARFGNFGDIGNN